MKDDEASSGLAGPPAAALNPGASAVLFRQIADRTPVVTIVTARPDGRIVFANPAALRAASQPSGGLTGRLVTDVFGFAESVSLAPGLQDPPDRRLVPDRGNGGVVWWDVTCVALDIPGSAPAVLITAVDVTRQAAASSRAQDTLDALLAYLPVGISISRGPDVHVERISAQGMALVGRGADELTGHSALQQTDVWEVYAPGSDVPLPPADRPLARATRTGQVTMNETLMVRRPDGTLLTVLCNAGPIRDPDGRVTGAVMAWHDVSALHRAQAALRDSEERMRAVLLQIPAAVFILEPPDGRLTFKSRLLDDVLGHPDINWLPPDGGTPRGWAFHSDGSPYTLPEYPSRRALLHGETVRAELMAYRRGDGRMIDLEIHAGPVRNETNDIIASVTVALDVTARRLQEERQAFLLKLQDSLRALTEPQDILTAAATQLGRHLGAARITYSEVQPDNQTMLITNGYVDGMPPLNGVFPLTIFGATHAARLKQGQTVTYEDVQAEDFAAQAVGGQLGSRGHVTVPLVRDGRYTGSLCVTHLRPHRWPADEVALIEDVADRIWDAAERGRAEVKLRESEERLRLVMDSAGLGTWEYDALTGKTIRSARHDEIFGYSEPLADWGYTQFTAHIPEPDRAVVEAGFRAAVEQGKDWDVECRMVRADGSPGWLTIRARPHYGPNGQVVRLLGTVADITARKQTEAAAIETAEKFEMFAQMMPSMVWTSLPDGQIDWFNARVPEYCGIPADELKPDGWTPVHPDDMESATRLWLEALASGQRYVAEYRVRRYDGEYRWHLTRAVPIRDADGRITRWVGASADIQDQKNSEQALAELNATLENQVRERTAELMAAEATLRQSQKMEAVGQLTGGLAHDFNNLLTAISGSLELLETRLAQGRVTELDRYLHVAQGAAKRAAALTHRLLAFSRRQTLDPKPTDINRLVGDMDELIRRTVGPSVTLRVAGAADLWAVLADPNQLENALLNLCINARDAMPDGGRLSIEAKNCTLDAADAKALELPPGAYVLLSVADTGSGMTADVIACAFDPFFTTKPIGEGTGLGLSMVYGFVRQSGGQARITSEPGKGTQVCLYLPRYSGEDDVLEAHAGAETAPRAAGETVLVVDDEPSLRMLVTEVLEGLGYSVVEAADGASGLKILESGRRVDLLITDVGLPGGMNGRQLADAGLVARPDLKILFITGYAENAVIGEGHLKPAMHIVTKPFSLEHLGRRIREIIAGG